MIEFMALEDQLKLINTNFDDKTKVSILPFPLDKVKQTPSYKKQEFPETVEEHPNESTNEKVNIDSNNPSIFMTQNEQKVKIE